MRKRSLIIGASGQDGYYLGQLLERCGHDVVRAGRSVVTLAGQGRPFDILDARLVLHLIAELQPDEVYYLAAHHHSAQEDTEAYPVLLMQSFEVHCQGLCNTLEAIKTASPVSRLFNASSSLVFGEPVVAPQDETTPVIPVCAYGATKAAGMAICRRYRRDHGIFCSSGILYNHESPRRDAKFITRKLVKAAVAASRGQCDKLVIGSFDGQVDWSAVEDVVAAMQAMLACDRPGDYVVASGVLHTVRDFAAGAYAMVGLDYRQFVEEDPNMLKRRPHAVPLQGNSGLLRATTGWQPRISFESLIESMVKSELGISHG